MPVTPPPHDDDRRSARLRAVGLPDDAAAGNTVDRLLDLVQCLRANDSRLSDFARASGDWLWETDAALNVTWLSDSFATSTGEPAANFIGRNLDQAQLFTAAGPTNTVDAVSALLQGRAAFTRVLTVMPTARGALKISHSAVPTFDAEGRFAGYRGTARDVTAQVDAEVQAQAQAVLLRQSEERWEMAAQATGIGIAELDVASNTMQLDDRARINHGMPNTTGPITLVAWLADIHSDDRPAVRGAVETAVAECGRLEVRYRMHGRDGIERVLEIVARATPGPDGRTQNIVGTCRNVTQQVAHEQLLRDKEGAERANRAKSEFLSRMSHELRTPLNGILGFTQLMALDRVHPLAPDQQRRLDSVHRAGRHLLGLINDVLDLARIESEDFSLKLEAVDLSAALDACLTLIVPLARDSHVVLPAPPNAPCWVQADRRGLDQVLMNLLSNAIKYNRAGGRVGVALHAEAGRVQLAIQDEGAGLTAAQQARLFQHFDRLGAEASRVEGTGLGLVISLDLARAMGADLQAHSQPGAGSTFTLSLPVAAAPPADTLALGTPQSAQTAPPGPQRQVLYIEDERLNVVLMEELFRTRPEWALSIAEDGAEGLQMARALRPHLVLIDMNLPDTTGLALIRSLRSDPATLPLTCIALSADAMSEQIEAALAAGFDEYWTKPIDVSRMLQDLSRRLA
jgi:signal transduction histidine kinase/ActR/RegA family two-component response regulator